MARKVVIFGAGTGGERTFRVLPKGDKVVAFSDNDARKHHQPFLGHNVVPPARLVDPDFHYDAVILASQYALEIAAQLLEMGVDRQKIELVEQEVLADARKLSPKTQAAMSIGIGFVLMGSYALLRWIVS